MWTSIAHNSFQTLVFAQADSTMAASFGRYWGLAKDIKVQFDQGVPASWIKAKIEEPVGNLPEIQKLASIRLMLQGIVDGSYGQSDEELVTPLHVVSDGIFDAGPRILDLEDLKKFEELSQVSLFPPATMRSQPFERALAVRPSVPPPSAAPKSSLARPVVPVAGKEDNILCDACYTLNEPKSSYCKACGSQIVEEAEFIIENKLCTGTVMFADLKGFTSATDRMSPQETIAFVNFICDRMREVAIRHGGRVNKFMGDNMMVVFGPPRKYDNHEERGVRCALEIVELVKGLNKGMEVRVGLNSGDFILGMIGKRLDVIGSVINVGERCESLKVEELGGPKGTKLQDGSEVIATDLPIEGLGPVLGWEVIGEVMMTVGGRRMPVKIYQRPKEEDALEDRIPAGNRVIVTDRTLIRLGDLFETDTIGDVPVKGVRHPVAMYNVLRANPKSRSRGAHNAKFRGRDRELEELRNNFRWPDKGWPRFVRVQAEAGQGKTRLANEFIDSVSEGREILRMMTVGVERDSHPPYYYVAELFKRAAQFDVEDTQDRKEAKVRALTHRAFGMDAEERELSVELLGYLMGVPFENPSEQMQYLMSEPVQLRTEIQQAVKDYFVALSHKKSLILELEDIQWADEESLNLLHETFERFDKEVNDGASHSIFGLALSRPEFEKTYPNLFNGEYAGATIKMGELDDQALNEMARELIENSITEEKMVDVAAFLVAQSGGNAYLLEAMAQAVQDGWLIEDEAGEGYVFQGPGGQTIGAHTDSFLQARIEHLNPEKQYLLEATAVLGDDISFESLSALGVVDPASLLKDLITQEFMQEEGDNTFSFRHALMRENVEKRLTEGREVALHKRAADYLIASDSDDFALIAAHLEAANKKSGAADYYLKAAAKSYGFGLYETGIAQYEKVYELSEVFQVQLSALYGWNDCLAFAGTTEHKERMHALLPKFEQIRRSLPERHESHSRIHYYKGLIFYYDDDFKAAEEEFLAGLAYYNDETTSTTKCQIFNALGSLHLQIDEDHSRAMQIFEQARDDAEQIDDIEQLGLSLTNISRIQQTVGYYSRALRTAQEAISILSDSPHHRLLIKAMNNAGSSLVPVGAYDDAQKIFSEAISIATKIMSGHHKDFLLTNLGEIKRLSYDADVLETLNEAYELVRPTGDTYHYAVNALYLSIAHADAGNMHTAKSFAEDVIRVAQKLKRPSVEAMGHYALARAYYESGDLNAALQANETSMQILKQVKAIPEFDLPILLLHGKIKIQLEEIEEAKAIIERAHIKIQRRAARITELHHKAGFLKLVKTNVDIQRLYQVFKDTSSDDQGQDIQAILFELDWHVPHKQQRATAFVDPQENAVPLERVLELTDKELDELIAKSGERGSSQAGITVDAPLPVVFTSLLSNPIEIAKNPGISIKKKQVDDPDDDPDVWAEEGFLKPFLVGESRGVSTEMTDKKIKLLRLHLAAKWKIASKDGLIEKGYEYAGRPSEYRLILRDRLYTHEGLIYIELQGTDMESIESVKGQTFEAPKDFQPLPEQFGQLKFIIESLNENETRIVFDFENALFTLYPENFLREAIKAIAKYILRQP